MVPAGVRAHSACRSRRLLGIRSAQDAEPKAREERARPASGRVGPRRGGTAKAQAQPLSSVQRVCCSFLVAAQRGPHPDPRRRRPRCSATCVHYLVNSDTLASTERYAVASAICFQSQYLL